MFTFDENERYDYLDHVSDAAAISAFLQGEEFTSAEELRENSSVIDFKTFVHDYPEKTFELLRGLPLPQAELFIEYYLIGKSQAFLAQCRKQIQARVFEALQMTEQALGALIVLGVNPSEEKLESILEPAHLNQTERGPLSRLIALYIKYRDYSKVAKAIKAPIPAIRKIFRPAVKTMLASPDLPTVAIGAYLKSLMHYASLAGPGYSKRYLRRMQAIRALEFTAPPVHPFPLLSKHPERLKDTPWCMFEISAEGKIADLMPAIRRHIENLKQPAQVFAPVDNNGALLYGYFFARCARPHLVRSLTRIRGVSEMSARYNDSGDVATTVTIPDEDVQKMIRTYDGDFGKPRVGDFVQVLTGAAKGYCGTVKAKSLVEVVFPTKRKFFVKTDPTSVKVLNTAKDKQYFWAAAVPGAPALN